MQDARPQPAPLHAFDNTLANTLQSLQIDGEAFTQPTA